MAASSPPTILLLLSLLLLLLSILLLPRTPQLQFPTTVLGAGDKHASVRDKTQIPRMKKKDEKIIAWRIIMSVQLGFYIRHWELGQEPDFRLGTWTLESLQHAHLKQC